MAKNYKETTTQAAVLRTSTKTLSFWCNIREAPLERFAELIEGNIRIALQDFSGGKGDKSKFAYFNLEFSRTNWKMSYEQYQKCYCPECSKKGCQHRNAYRRVPSIDGGLTLCPKLRSDK